MGPGNASYCFAAAAVSEQRLIKMWAQTAAVGGWTDIEHAT